MFDIFFNGRKAKYPSTHFPVRPCVYIIIILFPFPSSGIARSDLLLSFFLSLARRSYPLDEGRIRRKKEAAYLDPSQHAFFMYVLLFLALSAPTTHNHRSLWQEQNVGNSSISFASLSLSLFSLPLSHSLYLSLSLWVAPSGADNLYWTRTTSPLARTQQVRENKTYER